MPHRATSLALALGLATAGLCAGCVAQDDDTAEIRTDDLGSHVVTSSRLLDGDIATRIEDRDRSEALAEVVWDADSGRAEVHRIRTGQRYTFGRDQVERFVVAHTLAGHNRAAYAAWSYLEQKEREGFDICPSYAFGPSDWGTHADCVEDGPAMCDYINDGATNFTNPPLADTAVCISFYRCIPAASGGGYYPSFCMTDCQPGSIDPYCQGCSVAGSGGGGLGIALLAAIALVVRRRRRAAR